MKFRELYRYFMVVDRFAKRDLPRGMAINMGIRVMKLREFFLAADSRRTQLAEKYAKRNEEGGFVGSEEGGILLDDPMSYDRDWKELLDSEVEDYPEWPVDVALSSALPDDVSAAEVEALLRLGLMVE